MIEIICEQRSEAWHTARCGRFTASDFNTLMSGVKTIGYKDLISRIAAEIVTGETEETYQSEDMLIGIEREFEAKQFIGNIDNVGFCIPDENDELHEWIGCSPDGFYKDGLIEIKCPKRKTHWKYIQAGKLPTEYEWQVQGQMWVTGRLWCLFMSYYPGIIPFYVKVYPDKDMHEELRQRSLDSIELVKAEIKNYRKYIEAVQISL